MTVYCLTVKVAVMGIRKERYLFEVIKTSKNFWKTEKYSVHCSISSLMNDIHYMGQPMWSNN